MSSQDLEKRRITRLRAYAIDQAMSRYDADYPSFEPEEIVASICAYEEEGNIGDVLKKTDSGGLFVCTNVQEDRERASERRPS